MKLHIIIFVLIVSSAGAVGVERLDVSYDSMKVRIGARRQNFSERYGAASAADRAVVLQEAQSYLLNAIDTVFSYWYGTPWAFHGITRVPGQGSVACGYFVTTTLTDAGFQIPLVRWAQSASEPVIVKIGSNIRRFRNRPMSEVIDHINQSGDGLYLVGLDFHVGYIRKSGDMLRFVHSNYYDDGIGVMSEPLLGNNPLYNSRYRVIGKLLSAEMVENWITGKVYD